MPYKHADEIALKHWANSRYGKKTVSAPLGIEAGEYTIAFGPAFYLHRRRGWFWFRIFDYGMAAKDFRRRRPLFSERYDFGQLFLRIGPWRVELLTPSQGRMRRGGPRQPKGDCTDAN